MTTPEQQADATATVLRRRAVIERALALLNAHHALGDDAADLQAKFELEGEISCLPGFTGIMARAGLVAGIASRLTDGFHRAIAEQVVEEACHTLSGLDEALSSVGAVLDEAV